MCECTNHGQTCGKHIKPFQGHPLNLCRNNDKTTNITEYNDLIYEYRNDCLKASVEYKKHNYTNNDLKPEEELMFTLTIGTFGTIASPKY